jgi:hypothetical protein
MNVLDKIKELLHKYNNETGWRSSIAVGFNAEEAQDIINLIEAAADRVYDTSGCFNYSGGYSCLEVEEEQPCKHCRLIAALKPYYRRTDPSLQM